MNCTYENLFKTESDKAKAFDEIAKNYYFGNFGTMCKADFETLLFSLYLDKILEHEELSFNDYSDYTLSKELGITQEKIANLKVKKQLKYPSTGLDWKKSFAQVCKNARYENGKIKIGIPDRNLFIELQNAIESQGGYVDVQLNSKLLQVSPEYFVNLLLIISENENRKDIQTKFIRQLEENHVEFEVKGDCNIYFKEKLTDAGITLVLDLLTSAVPSGAIVKKVIESVTSVIKLIGSKYK